MKLIMQSEFENLRENDDHGYTIDKNGDKEVLKIYMGEKLIAKRIGHINKNKKSRRYFGSPDYKDFLN
jgi:hypothetical protein